MPLEGIPVSKIALSPLERGQRPSGRRRRLLRHGRSWWQGKDDEEATTSMEARSVEEENFPQIDAAELDEKHKRYEALYSRRLRAKYFSRKAFDGGDLFDQETTVDNEVIKSSRWPSTRSFADPIKYLEDQNQLSSEAETTSTSNRKQTPKKSY